jgi:hypothetical protein
VGGGTTSRGNVGQLDELLHRDSAGARTLRRTSAAVENCRQSLDDVRIELAE